MRDAFGGAFSIKLMLIFLAIFLAFCAVALNYSKAFRVKNGIIDIIEENEGLDNDVYVEIDNYVSNMDYYISSVGPNGSNARYKDCNGRGYCIYKMDSQYKGTYYKVVTFMEINFPFFGLSFPVAITGETRTLTKWEN